MSLREAYAKAYEDIDEDDFESNLEYINAINDYVRYLMKFNRK